LRAKTRLWIDAPESYVDFIDLVMSQLQRRRSYKTVYDDGSLREKLFHGEAHFPEQHTGAHYQH
jgi:hypothetical protein